ncbi:MAG TPA: Crp/Fnr family transcriptional regulator [Burkholderiales bacterium]|nr:Crp/Fnr family transcriptional regulator [Burkholderiales bacterium]
MPRLRIFWGVPAASLSPLTKQCLVLSVARGTNVVQRGARLPGVFALAYGSVKLSLRGDDAEERVVSLVSPGQTFGEAKALLGCASRSDAIALVDTKLIVIPSAAILSLMDREPRFARAMVFVLAERTLDLLGELESATQRGAHRLAAYIVALADGNGDTVQLPVSKTLVAARLGVKKETLSRLLRSLETRGLITVERREVRILDRTGLAAVTR